MPLITDKVHSRKLYSDMRCLAVTGFNYFPQSKGGAESSTNELALGLMQAGHKVAVLAALMPKRDLTYFKNRLISKLTQNPAPTDNFFGYPVYRAWRAYDALEEVCAHFKPDIVMVQSGEPARLTRLSLDLGFQTVLFLRDVDYSSHGGGYESHDNLNVIANSEFTSRRFKETFGIESIVVPPFIDPERYKVPPAEMESNSVLFINPHPNKGVDTAIELARLNPDIPFIFQESWQLDASLKAGLQQQTSSHANIEWRKPQSDMRALYKRARIVLIPSKCEEAWCRVASESHVNGIPIIASRIGGLPESVGPGGVLLDPLSEISEWDEALKCLWYDKELWDSLSLAAKRFSLRPEIQLHGLNQRVIKFLEGVFANSREFKKK